MKINKIAVMGAGLMGTGIAQTLSTGRFKVNLRDISTDILDSSRTKIDQQLHRLVDKGRLSDQEADDIMSRITFTESMEAAIEDVDFIIEAVPENLELKKDIFSEMDSLANPSAIFASNTSELSISALAEATSRRQKVIGTHWFFPPQLMKLIEVVVTPATSQDTLDTTIAFCKEIDKETVTCKDKQGFITSRAISALIAECLRIYEDGIASIEDIDKAMRLGFNHPIGPFQLADMSGLDVVYHSLEGLTQVFGNRFKPTETMARLIKKGHLGQKTSKGFYKYNKK
jgi:3-hydroxybutyryl-CoA dehydrogenase